MQLHELFQLVGELSEVSILYALDISEDSLHTRARSLLEGIYDGSRSMMHNKTREEVEGLTAQMTGALAAKMDYWLDMEPALGSTPVNLRD